MASTHEVPPLPPSLQRTPSAALTLDDRIVAALTGDISIAEISALIADTRTASLVASERAERLRQKRNDPTLRADAAMQARADADKAMFIDERLASALVQLKRRKDELSANEEAKLQRAAFAAARAQRDAMAAELKSKYPKLCAEIVDLLSRLQDCDMAVDAANAVRPRGEDLLLSAELVARGLPSFARSVGSDIPRLTRARLPAFRYDAQAESLYAWPSDSAFASAMPVMMKAMMDSMPKMSDENGSVRKR
jgi:hypothetical protein